MSNNLREHSYYHKIIEDMKKYADKVFSGNTRLLSINIDLENLDIKFNTELFQVKTVIEKQSKDVLFLKTILLEDKKILAQASGLWAKEN